MVALPNDVLQGVVFLYKTEASAKQHKKEGGTAFIVATSVSGTKNRRLPFLVSNRHVVYEGGASVIRVNRNDGKSPSIIPTEPTDWFPHPDGDDVVVRPAWDLDFSPRTHAVRLWGAEGILTEKRAAELDISIGDEVFMVGRFVNHQGRADNLPAVRFGNISVSKDSIAHPIYKKGQECFAVEMRSRTGFSGSPVYVYGTHSTTLNANHHKSRPKFFIEMLGVNWGYVLDETGENTWLNGVLPGWKILEVLAIPELVKLSAEEEDRIRRQEKGENGGTQLAFADEDDPTHVPTEGYRERFTRLKAAAVRPPEPSD